MTADGHTVSGPWTIGRRGVLAAGVAGLAAPATALPTTPDDGPLGGWREGPLGLPRYDYPGPLHFGQALLPDDPWFLLGNHRLTAFVHASGRVRLLSGERGWAAMNGRRGDHTATLSVDGVGSALVGDTAAAARAGRSFGVGDAVLTYEATAGVSLRRTLAVRPSLTVGRGTAALLVTVDIVNTGATPREVAYREAFGGHYEPIVPAWAKDSGVRYATSTTVDVAAGIARADTRLTAAPPTATPRPRAAPFDAAPPALFVAALDGCTAADAGGVGVTASRRLGAGERLRLTFAVGHAFAATAADLRAAADGLAHAARDGTFAAEWRRLVPTFGDEPDPVFRREMQWHVATLEGMATWLDYYDETIVPQGTTYDYDWGIVVASRDIAQHALPLCTLRPALARSVVRYLFKLTTADGEIKLSSTGFGWVASGPMQTSDQQLYLFLLLAEYLRATGDGSVLSEPVAWYPADVGAVATGLEHAGRAFAFLRDRIGTGPHGLVKLWNSDWNDMFFFWPTTVPYNHMFDTAESHMNSAMALSVLADTATQLERFAGGASLAAAMRATRTALAAAFVTDLGSRSFPRRAYLSDAGAVGETAMWLEPQGFALLAPDLPEARRRALWAELRGRLMTGEALGPRQIEAGPPQGDLALGARENGGFWYALVGPVVLGVARFDRSAAWDLLRQQTLDSFARRYPAYWTGRWSASDSLDAAPVRSAGLSVNPPWCAHAHAWPLYLYLKLGGAARA